MDIVIKDSLSHLPLHPRILAVPNGTPISERNPLPSASKNTQFTSYSVTTRLPSYHNDRTVHQPNPTPDHHPFETIRCDLLPPRIENIMTYEAITRNTYGGEYHC